MILDRISSRHTQYAVKWKASSRISDSQPTTSAFNSTTRVLCTCTAYGTAVLLHTASIGHPTPSTSSIRLSNQQITQTKWLNNHEFVAGGSSEPLILFNIITQKRIASFSPSGGVSSICVDGETVYAGRSDGIVSAYDVRCPHRIRQTASLVHSPSVHSPLSPVCSIESHGLSIYTALPLSRQLFLWDKRNLAKSLNTAHTVEPPSTIRMVEGALFSSEQMRLLRYSASLCLSELLSTGTPMGGHLHYSPQHSTIIWNSTGAAGIPPDGAEGLGFLRNPYAVENILPRRAQLRIEKAQIQPVKQLTGFELADGNRVLALTRDGQVRLGRLVQSLMIDD